MFYELVVSGVCGGGIQDLGGDAEDWEQLEGAFRGRERARGSTSPAPHSLGCISYFT